MPPIDAPAPSKRIVKRKKPKPYTPPPSRSDAAQRTGANTPKPKPTPKAAPPVQRGHASEGGKVIRPKTVRKVVRSQEKQARGKSDAAQGNQTRAADAHKSTPEYQADLVAARRVRLRRAIRDRDPITTTAAERATTGPKLDVRAELEGRGQLAKALEALGDFVARNATVPSTGGGPTLGGRGTYKAPKGAAAALTPGGVRLSDAKGAANIGGRLAKDLLSFPAQAIPSVYVPVAGLFEAAKGDPDRLERFARDVDQSDPLYNLTMAAVEGVRGNSDKANERLNRAKEAADAHPGFTLLEAAGVKGTLGRGAGTVMRSGATGKKLKRVASTERESRTVPGTDLEQRQTYSRDVTTKATQVATDKVQAGRGKRLRRKADETEDANVQAELRRKADRLDPTRMKPPEIKRRVDERFAANEDIRRAHRPRTLNEVDEIVNRVPEKHRVLISPIAQRIVKPDRDDIRAYVKDLADAHDSLDPAGKRANKTLQRELARAVNDPDLDMDVVQEAARAYTEHEAPAQRALTERELLDEDQAEKAALTPYAVRNMGARHSDEFAKTNTADARASLGHVEDRLARLERQRQQRIGQHRSARAREDAAGGRVSLNESKRVGEMDRLDRAIKSVKKERKTARAALSDTSRQGELLIKSERGGWVPLSAAEIRAHMENAGVDPAAYITQAPNQRGARNFNVRSERAQTISSRRRTGEATLKGTYDAHPDTLREGSARTQGLVDATDGFRGFVGEFGARGTSGKLKTATTKTQADRVIANLEAETGQKFRAIQLNPFGARRKQLETLLEDVNADTQLLDRAGDLSPVVEALEAALRGDGDGPWGFIPEEAAQQLQAHLERMSTSTAGKVGQMVNSAFRQTVLSTSPSWITGNIVEASMRTGIAKAGPRSYLQGRKVLKRLEEIDPVKAEEAAMRMIGGGHFSFAERQHIRNGAERFVGTRLEPLANALGKMWRAPGPKHAAGLWHKWTELVFHSVNPAIERQFQTAMLGKAIRDGNLIPDGLRKLSDEAVDQAAEGLRNTNEQVALGREIDRMYGRYGKLGPSERLVLAYYNPFLMWSLNAVRFVVDVLPRDHPTATAVIAASEIATEDWRKDRGLDLWMGEGSLPGFLQGSIPVGDDGKLRASRYTPFGMWGDPLDSVAGLWLPQFSGVKDAFEGRDWMGNKLTNPDGSDADTGTKAKAAARSFAEATIPVLGLAKRIVEDGPGTLNPAKVTRPPKRKVVQLAPSAWSDQDDSGDAEWADKADGGDAEWSDR